MADIASGAAQGATAGAALGPYGAAIGGVLGAASGAFGGGSAGGPVDFGKTGITFGSSNFKSAGAGDRYKDSGMAEPVAYAGAPAAGVPVYVWIIGAVVVLLFGGFFLLKKK